MSPVRVRFPAPIDTSPSAARDRGPSCFTARVHSRLFVFHGPRSFAALRVSIRSMDDLRGAGGTRGGLGTFFIGALMAVAGGYLLTSQVTVSTGYWRIWGYNGF